MDTTLTTQPQIKSYFATTLPKHQAGHVLALGEEHDTHEHLTFLNDHLSELIVEHNLGTIGMERPIFENVFFWAYQDGILSRMLGSQKAAREYLQRIDSGLVESEFQPHAAHKAKLITSALDSGIRVVAMDSRYTLPKDWTDNLERTLLLKTISTYAVVHHSTGSKVMMKMRHDPALAHTIYKKAAEEVYQHMPPEEILDYANHIGVSPAEVKPTLTERMEHLWAREELSYLLRLNPDYRQRLEKMETLATYAQRAQITTDAISAILFDAMAAPDKNSITLSGTAHICGVRVHSPDDTISGKFPDYLQLLHPNSSQQITVHSAVLATTAWIRNIPTDLHKRIEESSVSAPSRDEPTQLINIENDTITELPRPDFSEVEKAVGIDERYTKEYLRAAQNPFFTKEIQRLAASIHNDFHTGKSPSSWER